MNHTRILKSLVLVIFLAACAERTFEREEYQSSVSLPFLSECEADVRARALTLNRLSKVTKEIEVELKIFDRIAESHPRLIGFLELNSRAHSHEELLQYGIGLVSECDTTARIPFDNDPQSLRSELYTAITSLHGRGIDGVYLVWDEGKIWLRYRDPEEVRRIDEMVGM